MNKYQELITQPVYSFDIQKEANRFPPFARARLDKNSNYQSVLSDIANPIFDFHSQTIENLLAGTLHGSSVNDSVEFYLYNGTDPEKNISDNTFTYKYPSKVTAYQFNGQENLELVTIKNMVKEDLNDRLPLEIKDIEEKTKSLYVLEQTERKEYLLRVKDTCFIGFELIPHEGITYNAEDFFYKFIQKEETFYSVSFAQIKDIEGTPVNNLLILKGDSFGFKKEFSPGIYSLTFSLLEDSQLDNFDIEIIENNSFAKNKKGVNYGLIQSSDKIRYDYDNAFWGIDKGDSGSQNEYLFLISQNPLSNVPRQIYDAYTLLNENDEIQNISDWVGQDKLLYVLSNPESAESPDTSKIYIYDLLTTGNRFIYENNDKHFLDLVCEDIPFLAKDEEYIEKVTIETRINSFPVDITSPTMRLKIKNSENIDEITGEPVEYYIDKDGNIVDGTQAWRDYEDQQLRWDLYLDNIGSYKIICEVYISRELIVEAGAKLLTVKYKIPWKVFDTKSNYFGWKLGTGYSEKLELLNPNSNIKHLVSFYKDGYYFNPNSAEIWTNIECSKLLVEY